MEPIPETALALEAMDPVPGQSDDELLDGLRDSGDRVLLLVPDCVGFSLTRLHEGLVFTLVATAAEIAALDAVQYLDDGPLLCSAQRGEAVESATGDVLSEERWRAFAETATALDIQSTLTLPIKTGDAVTGSVNLYARSPHAFDGHHVALAEVFGAWAPGAVANADMSFETRAAARAAPQVVADRSRVQTAVGILAAVAQLEVGEAEERFVRAARQVPMAQGELASTVIRLLGGGRTH